MVRIRKKRSHLESGIQILILTAILIFSFVSCKSIFGTDEPADEGIAEGIIARIIVSNQYGESLDIYMDGIFQFMLGHKSDAKISDVSLAEHNLEAKIADTATVVATTTINVVSKVDYTWTIDDPPDINVINQSGRTLKIYMDDVYRFDLVDEENRWLIDVPFGERFLKATRPSDNTEYASVTVNVTENKDYSWTIQ